MKLLGLVCLLPKWMGGGHRRRTVIVAVESMGGVEVSLTYKDGITVSPGYSLAECERCGKQWTRKTRKKPGTRGAV